VCLCSRKELLWTSSSREPRLLEKASLYKLF
jgi:hypothetical protein